MIKYLKCDYDAELGIDRYIFDDNGKTVTITLAANKVLLLLKLPKSFKIVAKWYVPDILAYHVSQDKETVYKYVSKIPEMQIACDVLRKQELAMKIREEYWIGGLK